MKVKFMNDYAQMPLRGSSYAAGYDIYAAEPEDIVIAPHRTRRIRTGLAMEIPGGCFGGLVARSGVATKRGLRLAQGLAIIDSDYRGEILVPIHNDTDLPQTIQRGERICQLIIMPYVTADFQLVDSLDETERGEGGFGSTGIK